MMPALDRCPRSDFRPEQAVSIRRVLLCSMAVPWPSKPLLGIYHVRQAQALAGLNVETELFSPAPFVPGWAARLNGRLARHRERPTRYASETVVTHSPRVAFAFPRAMRTRMAACAPSAVCRFAANAMGNALDRTCAQVEPDILLAHGVIPWSETVAGVAERRGIPHAFVEHSVGDVLRLRPGSRLGDHYRRAAARARSVVVVSPTMADHLTRVMGLTNVACIPNGAALPTPGELAEPRPADLRQRKIILSAGNYYERKNFERLVQAFAKVATRHPGAVLILITDAPPALRAQVNSLKLGDRVRILPSMPQPQLRQWMRWSDLFALPSWSEAFGLVFIEAMACETPVLMAHDCGLAPLLDLAMETTPLPQQHGWSVDPMRVDSIAHALADALRGDDDVAPLSRMGTAGRALVEERFTWNHNASALLTALGSATR